MLEQHEKDAIISEILESPDFKDAGRYGDLLRYLYRETLAGTVPKEITIANEFFRKEASFDPKEDPTVRVYLNNLRKKLEHYYLSSTKPLLYRVEIPRGHYQVEFVPVEAKPGKSRLVPVLASIIALLSVTVLILLVLPRSTADREKLAGDPVWKEFMIPSGRPTLVVLGDFFFLYERDSAGGNRKFVRNIDINSVEDFRERVKRDPTFAARYVQSDFTFLRPSASWGLATILPILEKSPNAFALKLATQFTVDDLKTHNVIFIGSFKTLYSLQKFLHVFGLTFSLFPNRLQIRGSTPDSVLEFSPAEIKGGNYEKDYSVVAKGPGPEGSTIVLLLGFSDSGVLEASRAFLDPRMIADAAQRQTAKPPGDPFHFTMIVETEGLNQSIFKTQIRYFITR